VDSLESLVDSWVSKAACKQENCMKPLFSLSHTHARTRTRARTRTHTHTHKTSISRQSPMQLWLHFFLGNLVITASCKLLELIAIYRTYTAFNMFSLN
jgi:hypothetical protein